MPNSVEPSSNLLSVSMSRQDHDEQTVRRAMLILCGFELLLATLTFPVWFGVSEVPRIPLFRFLPVLAPAADTVFVVLFFAGIITLAVALIRHSSHDNIRAIATVALVAGTGVIICSMHRLQAWHWLLIQCLLVISTLRKSSDQKYVLQKIPGIIYLCSALSRFSPEIDQSMTGQVVSAILKSANLRMAAENSDLIFRLAWTFAIGELLVGVLLMIPRVQRSAAFAAMILHGILLVGLGPLGLNHHAGVLIWNLCFLCLLPVLYNLFDRAGIPPAEVPLPTDVQQTSDHHRRRGLAIVLFLFPLSSLFGLADNWPGWQLYSSRPEVWAMYVKQESVPLLPKTVQPFVGPPRPLDDWCPVRLDRWVLNQTGAPIYPEDRYQSALIRAITSEFQTDADLRVEISEPSIFPWWNRQYRIIEGRTALANSLEF